MLVVAEASNAGWLVAAEKLREVVEAGALLRRNASNTRGKHNHKTQAAMMSNGS